MCSWPSTQPKWNEEYLKLLLDGSTSTSTVQKHSTNLKEIIVKSRDFPIKFPIVPMICQNLLPSTGEEILERNINSVYPIIHEHSLFLCILFLLFKREHGTTIEKNYYKNISGKELIDRFLSKRAVTFMEKSDLHLLLDGTRGYGNWETIGTNREKSPLTLANYLSYDEIKLSALLSVSSYSYFINDGNRFNSGVIERNRTKLQQEGIIIGLIGTRLEKEHVMEYEEMVISRQQNTEANGYGNDCSTPSLHKLFANFYEDQSFTYNNERVKNDIRFVMLEDGLFFDNIAYSKRLALSFDTLLLEANYRAKERNATAYIHVVGIGLGVWKISSHQGKQFVKTFAERLSFLGKHLAHVSDVHFAYFSGISDCGGYKNGDIFPIANHPNKGIKILISKREPFSKLSDEGKLLVVSYAWDGNALPGNEFWIDILASTGDSAAAASSQIAELHNPHINKLVCADNLMVATLNGTVVPFYEYIEQIKNNE